MKQVSLSGSSRQGVGKTDAKSLRYEGKVPCVLYGGKSQVHFSVNEKDFKELLYTPNVYRVDLSVDDKNYSAIVKDAQFHAVSDQLLHVDFLELFEDKKVKIDIPVRINGTAKGVKSGGKLIIKTRKITISALPKDLPEFIDVEVTKLNIGQVARVKDVTPSNFEFVSGPMTVVAYVKGKISQITADEEEGTEETPAAE
jgi:large subunit ribosomal protein L25